MVFFFANEFSPNLMAIVSEQFVILSWHGAAACL
jgi:hypothetical protein